MAQDIDIPIAGGLDVALPRMVTVRQAFDDSCLDDVAGTVRAQILQDHVARRIKPARAIKTSELVFRSDLFEAIVFLPEAAGA